MADIIKRTVYVIGIVQSDGWIMMDCALCGRTELRQKTGENWCDATQESFLLVVFIWSEEVGSHG